MKAEQLGGSSEIKLATADRLNISVPADIPLDYRLAHLGINPQMTGEPQTAEKIGEEIGTNAKWIHRLMVRFGVVPKLDAHPQNNLEDVKFYPAFATELAREEYEWRQHYLLLPSRMNANQISEEVGRSYGWTTKTLNGLYPNPPRQRSSYKSLTYPRIAVQHLRDLTIATPPDENWHTLGKLKEITGFDREWIEKVLNKAGLKPEERRAVLTGRELLHYPPEAEEILREAAERRAPPAGNWLTVQTIEDLLSKSHPWVQSRIDKYFSNLGELRQDDNKVERVHYPGNVLSALQEELDIINVTPEAKDWSTISALESELGKHALTLKKLLEKDALRPRMRLNKKGYISPHYSPAVKIHLKNEIKRLESSVG